MNVQPEEKKRGRTLQVGRESNKSIEDAISKRR